MKLVPRALMNVKNIGGLILTNWTNHKTTQEWMKTQAIWHSSDMIVCGIVTFAIGLLLGYII